MNKSCYYIMYVPILLRITIDKILRKRIKYYNNENGRKNSIN